MNQQFFIAIGSGLAAALLFFIPVKGTAFAMTLAMFAALPLMIAGLAFSSSPPSSAPSPARSHCSSASCCSPTSNLARLLFCSFFALTAALPAWWLTRLAWLARPPSRARRRRPMAWSGIRSAASRCGWASSPPPPLHRRLRRRRAHGCSRLRHGNRRSASSRDRALFGGAKSMPGGLRAAELARTFVLATGPLMADGPPRASPSTCGSPAASRSCRAACAGPGRRAGHLELPRERCPRWRSRWR